MTTDDKAKNIFVSRASVEKLAKAYATCDEMLTFLAKTAESFRDTNIEISPQGLIDYITNNRPNFLETQDEQN